MICVGNAGFWRKRCNGEGAPRHLAGGGRPALAALERLVEERVGTHVKAVSLVEGLAAAVVGRELQLQSDEVGGGQVSFGANEEHPPYSLGAPFGQYEEFIDLGHQAAVLEAPDRHGKQVADGLIGVFGDPADAPLGMLEELGEQRRDAGVSEALNAFEFPVALDEPGECVGVGGACGSNGGGHGVARLNA